MNKRKTCNLINNNNLNSFITPKSTTFLHSCNDNYSEKFITGKIY